MPNRHAGWQRVASQTSAFPRPKIFGRKKIEIEKKGVPNIN
jgi:hypothetical protein